MEYKPKEYKPIDYSELNLNEDMVTIPLELDYKWFEYKKTMKLEKLQCDSLKSPDYDPKTHIRFVCVSDTHNMPEIFNNLPKGDVLLHSGDFSMIGQPLEVKNFIKDLSSTDFKYKVVIAGNHELTFETDFFIKEKKRLAKMYDEDYATLDAKELKDYFINSRCCDYLEDSSIIIEGYKIWGSPWSPFFHNWAFNAVRGEDIMQYWDLIPNDTDILLTHGPPLGIGDLCYGDMINHYGCEDLLKTIINRVKPKVNLFGHIHENYGVWTDGTTNYINASICDYGYSTTQKPIVFDLPRKI